MSSLRTALAQSSTSALTCDSLFIRRSRAVAVVVASGLGIANPSLLCSDGELMGWCVVGRYRASASRGQSGDELVQPLVPLVDADLHPGLDHLVAVLDRLEDRARAQQGPPVALLEGQRLQADVPRH